MKRLFFALPLLLWCGCISHNPQVAAPAEQVNVQAPRPAQSAREPLVIEAVLLPDPGGPACPEAPMRRAGYINEIRECYELGASVIRVQPLAADSGPGNYRFDRSLSNYRSLVCEVLGAAPEAVIDLDLEGAGEDVREWVKNNERIEIDSGRQAAGAFEAAGGKAPLLAMRRIIAGDTHLRLGLGESRAWPHKGSATNLDYLRQAISLARKAGRPVATPLEARGLLDLPPPQALYLVPSRTTVKRGQTFSLDAIVGPLDQPFKAYAVIITPRGGRRSISKKGKIVRRVVPFAGGRELKGVACKALIDMVLDKKLPPGEFKMYLGIFSPRDVVRPWLARHMTETKITIQ